MEVSWSELQRRSQTEVEMEEGKSGLGATKRNPPDFSRFLSDILTTPIPVHSHCLREPQLVTVIMLNLLSRPSLPMFGGSSIGPLAAFRWSSTATQDTIAFLQQQRQQKSMCLLHSSIERNGIIWRNRDRILCVVLLADVQ